MKLQDSGDLHGKCVQCIKYNKVERLRVRANLRTPRTKRRNYLFPDYLTPPQKTQKTTRPRQNWTIKQKLNKSEVE